MKNPTTSPSSPRKSLALCRAVGIALLVVSAATPWAALASTVPLDFPVELSRPARLEFNAYYGEAIDITATLNYQGSAFEGSLTDPQLYYQTPTMGTSFWSLPATQTNNLLKVVFPASAQPGPGRLNCFLGSAGENYRAAFVLNLRPSPGASPNSLPLPTPTLDFSQVTILNSPYETSADASTAHSNLEASISAAQASISSVSNALESAQADLSRQIAAATPADYADVKSQVATNTAAISSHSSQLSQLSQGVAAALTTETDPTVPSWAKSSTKPSYSYSEISGTPTIPTVPTDVSAFNNDAGYLLAETDPTVPSWAKVSSPPYLTSYTETDPTISSWAKAVTKPTYTLNEVAPSSENWLGVQGNAGRVIKILAQGAGSSPAGGIQVTASTLNNNNTTTYAYSGVAVKRNGTNTDYLFDTSSQSGIVRRSELGDYATMVDLDDKADASITNQISTIVNYLTGDDARVIITNLDSQVEMPHLSFEWKVADNGTNYWSTIWDELTRFTWMQNTYLPTYYHTKTEIASLLDEKADRAWGFYDSHTGSYAPDGYTWISSPSIAISGGLVYEKYITSAGNIWLLESNGLTVQTTGVETNGFLRISDGDGTVLSEIIKGDKRTVGAAASSVSVNGTTLSALYPVASAEHPTLYASTNLVSFVAESDNSCPCTVVWSGTSGAWTAAITPKGSTPAVFAKAEYEIGGETYIHHAAPTKLDYIIINNTKYSLGTATISGNTVLTLTEAL